MSDADRIAVLEARVQSLETVLGALRAVFVGESKHPVADEDELDSKFGNPQIRRDPTVRYWKGESFKGRTLSQCPADYLDAFAKYKDSCAFMSEKDGSPEKKKYAEYDRKDAARSRGWSARIRSGWKAPPEPAQPRYVDDNPFSDVAPPREFRPSYPQPVAPMGHDAPNPFASTNASGPFSGPSDADDTFDFGANVDEEIPL